MIMTEDTTTTDPIAAQRAAELAGIEHLRSLREQHAALVSEQDVKRTAIADQLAAAEAAFARVEADRGRLERLQQARDSYQVAQDAYQPLADTADQLVARLHTALADLIRLYGDAALAERARDQSGKRLTTAHGALKHHNPEAPAPRIGRLRLHNLPMTEPIGLLGIAVALTDDRFLSERADAKRLVEAKRAPMPNVTVVTKN
jgi:hypothetical protein